MNKLYFAGAAALAALTLASCSNDDMPVGGGEGKTTFSIQLPAGLGTRAFGDGTSAKKLYVAVYEKGTANVLMSNFPGQTLNDDLIVATDFVSAGANPTATVTIDLVKNQSYDIAFFAQTEDAPYTYDNAAQTVTVDYISAVASAENRDAFFTYEGIVADGTIHDVTLRRPFAQLNIGTNDLAAAKAAGLDVTSAGVVVSNVATAFNVATGVTTGDESVTFTSAALPADETFPVSGYDYLTMAYVLPVGTISDKAVVSSVGLLVNADTNAFAEYANVPVQGNYRTNIYGSLLTNKENFNVEIEPAFETPDYDYVVAPETADEFAAALTSPAAATIKVNKDLDLSSLSAAQLQLTAEKEIELADNVELTLPSNAFIATSSDLTITGAGTITNADGEAYPNVTAGQPGSKSLIHQTGGTLTIDGATLVNDMDYHYHGNPYNSAAIGYWNDANVVIKNATVKSGEYALCGYGRGVASGTITLQDSYFESTSSNANNGVNWSYAMRIMGSEATLDNCTVVGIQGGASFDGGVNATINSGVYTTHNSEGKMDAFYPVYITDNAIVTVNGGYFYGPNNYSPLCEGTSAIVSGNNDVNLPSGSVILNGGYMSGKAYNHTTKQVYEPSTGYKYDEVNASANGLTYKWAVVKE